MRGLNSRPLRYKHNALPTELMELVILNFSARSGIRTHEAEARDLKTRPFDRSGIRANIHLN